MRTAVCLGALFFASLLIGMSVSPAPPQFGPTAYYPVAQAAYRVGTLINVLDVNHDGFPDVIVIGPGTSMITAWLGNSAGKLKERVDSDIVEKVYSSGNVTFGDFDGDGNLDLVVSMNNSPLQLMKGDGKGRFTRGERFPRVDKIIDCPGPLVASDVNRDGKLDVIANQCGEGGLGVFLNRGDGTFSPPSIIDVPGRNRSADQSMVVADFNRDGLPDIALGTLTGIAVFLGQPDGTFSTPAVVSTGFPIKLASADLNMDGNPDLVVLPGDPSVRPAPMLGSAGNKVTVLLGDGKGAFKILDPFAIKFSGFPEDGGYPNHVSLADLNGDRVPDLVITKQQYSYAADKPLMRCMVVLGKGDGRFANPVEYRNPGETRHYPRYSFALGDLNRDGKLDMVFLDDRTGNQIGVAYNITGRLAASGAAKKMPPTPRKPSN